MTASLPRDVQAVFERFVTSELTTIDQLGQPITWPVTPSYRAGAPCIDVTTGLGYPTKANDAQANPLVTLLFSDPAGSGLTDPPMVLVQGSAEVDAGDVKSDRICIHVRPERVYVWQHRDAATEPQLYGAHMEEVRSGHSEEPARFHANPEGGASVWDARIKELGTRYPTAVLSIVCPDGFPFAVRVPVRADEANRCIRIEGAPAGVPFQPGLACLAGHVHAEGFSWDEHLQLRGDLVFLDDAWALVPHRVVGEAEVRA